MASFTGKPMKDVYKDILQTDNSNTGLSKTIKQIKCGDGDTTALYLSNRNAKIQPGADSTTNTAIYDADGNALVVVDSTNDLVKLGIGQHTANTQFKSFGLWDFSPTIGEHHHLVSQPGLPPTASDDDFDGEVNNTAWGGTGDNPSDSLTITSDAKELVAGLWIVQGNIYIDEIQYILSTAAVSTIGIQVMSYAIVSGAGGTAGDLSSGDVISQTGADGDNITPVVTGDDRITNGTLTVNFPSVNSGRAIVVFAESSDADDMTVHINIKYHLR